MSVREFPEEEFLEIAPILALAFKTQMQKTSYQSLQFSVLLPFTVIIVVFFTTVVDKSPEDSNPELL